MAAEHVVEGNRRARPAKRHFMMTGEASHREAPWPVIRNAVISLLRQHRPHTAYGMGEIDVTEALLKIREQQRSLRIAVSFHAFAMYCLARAASEHRAVQTYRYGRKLIVFEHVDVG